MKSKKVPQATISRFPLYLRALVNLLAREVRIVSSQQLAEEVGTNSAQIRKDFSHVGEFGTRGVGYIVEDLIEQISKFLGLLRSKKVILVGAGKFGSSLLSYQGFRERGFEVVAAFDIDQRKIGKKAGGVTVQNVDEIEETVKNIGRVDVGIIATPAGAAQEAAERLVKAGVKSILNLVPVNLEAPEGVPLRSVDLSGELQILSYYLLRTETKRGPKKRPK